MKQIPFFASTRLAKMFWTMSAAERRYWLEMTKEEGKVHSLDQWRLGKISLTGWLLSKGTQMPWSSGALARLAQHREWLGDVAKSGLVDPAQLGAEKKKTIRAFAKHMHQVASEAMHQIDASRRPGEWQSFGQAIAPLLKTLLPEYEPGSADAPLWMLAAVATHDKEMLQHLSQFKATALGSYVMHEELAALPGALEAHLQAGMKLTDKVSGVEVVRHLERWLEPKELPNVLKRLRQEDPKFALEWEGDKIFWVLRGGYHTGPTISPAAQDLRTIEALPPSRADWYNLKSQGTPIWLRILTNTDQRSFENNLRHCLAKSPAIEGSGDVVWSAMASFLRYSSQVDKIMGLPQTTELLQRFYPQRGMLIPAHLDAHGAGWMAEPGVTTQIYRSIKDPLFWLGQPQHQHQHGVLILSRLASRKINAQGLGKIIWVANKISSFSTVDPALKAALAACCFAAGKAPPAKLTEGASFQRLPAELVAKFKSAYPKAASQVNLMQMQEAVSLPSDAVARKRM